MGRLKGQYYYRVRLLITPAFDNKPIVRSIITIHGLDTRSPRTWVAYEAKDVLCIGYTTTICFLLSSQKGESLHMITMPTIPGRDLTRPCRYSAETYRLREEEREIHTVFCQPYKY